MNQEDKEVAGTCMSMSMIKRRIKKSSNRSRCSKSRRSSRIKSRSKLDGS